RVRSRELSGGHSVPPDKIRSRYAKSIANIPRLILCDTLRIVDNTSDPTVIYNKDALGEQIKPNRYWSASAISRLICPP
ncbi:MAG: hypothetical protein LBK56_07315, partial [Gracilibacteraceae bacterium]|nr:hypothetical protein [Gracilibacteraceae bacterium]